MFEDDNKEIENKPKQPVVEENQQDDQEEDSGQQAVEENEEGGSSEQEEGSDNESKKSPKDRTPPWMQRRINKEVAEKHALRRENEELKRKLSTTPPSEEWGESENLSEDEVERRAEIKVARREFDKACNRTYDAGVGEFSDFSSKLKDLRENVGELPIPMIEVINDLEGGHKILHHLATDFEEAARIYELPLPKMAIELAKLGDKLTKPKTKPISKAPPPVVTVGGGKKIADGLADSLSDEEWIRRRNEQRRKMGKL